MLKREPQRHAIRILKSTEKKPENIRKRYTNCLEKTLMLKDA